MNYQQFNKKCLSLRSLWRKKKLKLLQEVPSCQITMPVSLALIIRLNGQTRTPLRFHPPPGPRKRKAGGKKHLYTKKCL